MSEIGIANTTQIERRYRPSQREFLHAFLAPRRPVVISGALRDWPALQKWSPDFFKERYGCVPLKVEGQPYTLGGFLPEKKNGEPLTLGELIDLVLSSTDENPAPYLRNVHIEKFLPALNADLEPLPPYFSPNWLDGPFTSPLQSRLHGGRCELYIGGRGGKFPVLHYDTWHIYTFLCQLYGVKEYTIFAPGQTPFLYAKGNQSALPNLDNVDLEKYSLYAQATPIRFELHPGEILFVPTGWWHTTRILTPSITVSASRVNASNWSDFASDLACRAPKQVRPLVSTYLGGLALFRRFYDSLHARAEA